MVGTSFISRLLAARFQIVSPKAMGEVGEDVVPVYSVGSDDARLGLAVRPAAGFGNSPAVAAQFSYMLLELLPTSEVELVVRSVLVSSIGNLRGFYQLHPVGFAAFGMTVLTPNYFTGGPAQAVGPHVRFGFQASAAPPATVPLDNFNFPAGAGVTLHREFASGLLIRPGSGIMIVNTVLNEGIQVGFHWTERPLST